MIYLTLARWILTVLAVLTLGELVGLPAFQWAGETVAWLAELAASWLWDWLKSQAV